MANIAVVLSGCGVFDGSEIHESVLTFLALEENQATYQCFAPDIDQHHVINHINGEEVNEKRNVLIESARIARGEIKPMTALNANDFDGLVFPGGFGAAKNLCDFAFNGKDSQVEPSVLQVAKSFVEMKKPIGFICIAPAMIPLIYDKPCQLTIGNDDNTAQAIEQMGGQHEICQVDEIVIDETNRVVSTPAYMLANSVSEAASGIRKLIAQLIRMTQ